MTEYRKDHQPTEQEKLDKIAASKMPHPKYKPSGEVFRTVRGVTYKIDVSEAIKAFNAEGLTRTRAVAHFLSDEVVYVTITGEEPICPSSK